MNTLRRSTALLALCTLAAAVHAGPVQVTVTSADGKPVPDTVVLVQPAAPWQPQPLPAPVVIAQKDIKFVPYVSVVPVGGTVRFVNKDGFDHHVRSLPGGPLGTIAPAKQFEIRMPAATANHESSNDLKLDLPGVIALGCHLHGSMRGHVFVSTTPWYAVTDANGKATIAGVPEGQAELKLWHPEQLTDQPDMRIQVAAAGTAVAADAKLNFTPKPRTKAPARQQYSY